MGNFGELATGFIGYDEQVAMLRRASVTIHLALYETVPRMGLERDGVAAPAQNRRSYTLMTSPGAMNDSGVTLPSTAWLPVVRTTEA